MKQWFSGPVGKGRGMLLLILGGGLLTLAVAAIDYHFVTQTQADFKPVPCYVDVCTFTKERGRDDQNIPRWNYVPLVSYRYTVGEQEYVSGTVSSRTSIISTEGGMESFLRRFGPGSDASCFVNPDDPSDAMLELPTTEQAKLLAKFGGFGLMLAVVGLAALQVMVSVDTAPKRRTTGRAPGWGEIDSGPQDALARTRSILRERLES